MIGNDDSVEAKSASLLSALKTVAELRTNLKQLSTLVHFGSASICDLNQGVRSQVDEVLDKTSHRTFAKFSEMDTRGTFTNNGLESVARSVLNASIMLVNILQEHRRCMSEAVQNVAVTAMESELIRIEAVQNAMGNLSWGFDNGVTGDNSCTNSGDNHVSRAHDVSAGSPFNQTAVFELLEQQVNSSVEELERVNKEFKGKLLQVS